MTFYPNGQAIKALIREIKELPGQRLHTPASYFWSRLNMADASEAEKQECAELLRRRNLAFTFDTRRDAVYLVWTGDLQRRPKTPKSARNAALEQEKLRKRKLRP